MVLGKIVIKSGANEILYLNGKTVLDKNALF